MMINQSNDIIQCQHQQQRKIISLMVSFYSIKDGDSEVFFLVVESHINFSHR